MSTSSNENECDNLQYGGAWTNEMESPWYSSFGQPLVYFSQVQPLPRWQRIRETDKEKANCFKKAFRWYTQEHKPFLNGHKGSSHNMNNDHLKGFATWLDDKYNEFLQTSQIDRSKYILTQTSTVEIDNITRCQQCAPPVATKFKRVKSPWKKRRKYLNATEKGDVIMKSNKSIEIILKPKDLSYAASECSQRTKAHSCCNRVNNTVESDASCTHRVMKPKSQSLTSVIKEKEINMVPFDIPDYCAKNEEREHEKCSNCNTQKNEWKTRTNHPMNVSCQCSKYMREGIDAYSQFEEQETKAPACTYKLNEKEVIPSLDRNDVKKETVTTGTEARVSQLNTSLEGAVQKVETSFTATSTRTEKNSDAFLVFVNDSVQTSDHPINLNQTLNPEYYPLFMKIVRADKLKDN